MINKLSASHWATQNLFQQQGTKQRSRGGGLGEGKQWEAEDGKSGTCYGTVEAEGACCHAHTLPDCEEWHECDWLGDCGWASAEKGERNALQSITAVQRWLRQQPRNRRPEGWKTEKRSGIIRQEWGAAGEDGLICRDWPVRHMTGGGGQDWYKLKKLHGWCSSTLVNSRLLLCPSGHNGESNYGTETDEELCLCLTGGQQQLCCFTEPMGQSCPVIHRGRRSTCKIFVLLLDAGTLHRVKHLLTWDLLSNKT